VLQVPRVRRSGTRQDKNPRHPKKGIISRYCVIFHIILLTVPLWDFDFWRRHIALSGYNAFAVTFSEWGHGGWESQLGGVNPDHSATHKRARGVVNRPIAAVPHGAFEHTILVTHTICATPATTRAKAKEGSYVTPSPPTKRSEEPRSAPSTTNTRRGTGPHPHVNSGHACILQPRRPRSPFGVSRRQMAGTVKG
jgi:hypothetical protein